MRHGRNQWQRRPTPQPARTRSTRRTRRSSSRFATSSRKCAAVSTSSTARFNFNEEKPELSSVEFTIEAASIDTDERTATTTCARPTSSTSRSFLTWTFEEQADRQERRESHDVIGDLTIKRRLGVVLPVTFWASQRSVGHERVGFEARTTLNRKDFGLVEPAARIRRPSRRRRCESQPVDSGHRAVAAGSGQPAAGSERGASQRVKTPPPMPLLRDASPANSGTLGRKVRLDLGLWISELRVSRKYRPGALLTADQRVLRFSKPASELQPVR